MIWGYLATAILSLIGYLIFIPRYGAFGAGWITVFSEVLIMILTGAMVAKTFWVRPSFNIFGKSLLSSILMILAMRFVPLPHFVYTILLGGVVYIMMIFLTGGLTKGMLMEIIKNK